MEKVTLFQSLVRENKIKAAYLVARNEFYRKPGHSSNFEQYLEFCLKVGSNPVELETREFFIKEAEKALGHYADHVVMNEKALKEIVRYREMLVDARESLEKELQEARIEEYKKISGENDVILNQLQGLKQEIGVAKEEKELEKILITVWETDKKIRKDGFTGRQQVRYQMLLSELPSLIQERRHLFEKKETGLYNEQAVNELKAVFEEFKKREEVYCSEEDMLQDLAEKLLLSYEVDRFFEETRRYYSYIDSYIFERLDDEGKFKWTAYGIRAKAK